MQGNKPAVGIRRKRPSNVFEFLIIISNSFEDNPIEVPSIDEINKKGSNNGD